MAKNKKFGKLGVNEKYIQQNPDEATKVKDKNARKGLGKLFSKIKSAAKVNKAILDDNKNESAERFTYTKTTRTHEKKERAVIVPKAPLAPMVLFICCMCLSIAGAFFLDAGFVYDSSVGMQSALKIAVSICVYTVPVVVYVLTSEKRRRFYNVRKCSVKYMPLIFVFLGLVLFSSALQKYIIAYVFSYREPMGIQHGGIVLACITGALVPAICEELLFRGILQYEFSKYAGGAGGVIFTAFLFTLLHFDLRFFLVYFVAGLILGTLTHVTRSVFPAMAVHFLNNTFAICLSDRITFVALERIGGTLLMIALSAFCFILLAVALQMMEKISMRRAVDYLKRNNKDDVDVKKEDQPILFVASEGASFRRIMKLFANGLSVACYAIFAITVLVLLQL